VLVNYRAFGIASEFISPSEAGEKWPNMRIDDLLVRIKFLGFSRVIF
jgi:hypothetical protein